MAVADTIDDALTDQQNPNLTHTVGFTVTSLALALILGVDDVSDIDLLDPLVSTGLITQAGVRFHDPPPPPRTGPTRRSRAHPAGGGDEHPAHPGMEHARAAQPGCTGHCR
ncbi:hypothetical protein [Corynebacterium maris]|uniref:hypothetical protein n=1 Tax=Corynebacterium maris TaxID=575200 RepID=UPI0012EB41D7|nr:hypothetical protein [Corynebacterium maris]